MQTGSGSFNMEYSAGSRFKEDKGTNPEELIAAAHAGCFTMALAGILKNEGVNFTEVRTDAKVAIEKQNGEYKIIRSELDTHLTADNIDEGKFQKLAEQAKNNCPVSKALTGVDITLKTKISKD